jgi:hypothetical protein
MSLIGSFSKLHPLPSVDGGKASFWEPMSRFSVGDRPHKMLRVDHKPMPKPLQQTVGRLIFEVELSA